MNPIRFTMLCSRNLFALALLAPAIAFTPPRAAAAPAIEAKSVGPAWENGTIYTISPTGMHVATMHAKGSRFVVTVDGVEGPAFDEILKTAGELEVRYEPVSLRPVLAYKWQGPVAFSPDGKRHAYTARLGKEIVVMLDNKEIHRAPHSDSFPPVSHVFFSPDSRHLFFYSRTTHTAQSHVLMIDGKAATEPFTGTPAPIFSADGRRWLLLAAKPGASGEPFLVIDGKNAGYVGANPQFSPDGKRVVSIRGNDRSAGGGSSVLVDGKPILTVPSLHNGNYVLSARGDVAAIGVMEGGARRQLFINGKPAPAADNAYSVIFSPDGKRWAAQCIEHPMSWVVVDGVKHQHYSRVSNIAFTPDSSKSVYVAESGTKKFVVIDGEEDAGSAHVVESPFFAETGNRIAYVVKETPQGLGGHRATIDRQPLTIDQAIRRFTLSPDGSRHAYTAAVDALSTRLIIDEELVGTGFAQGDQVLFSADSRHVAAIVRPPEGKNQALYLDGTYISSDDFKATSLETFTPDARHLLTFARESAARGGVGNVHTYHLNGDEIAQFAQRGVTWANPVEQRKSWEVQQDGSIVLVGPAPTADRTYGPMKRVTVVPSKGGDLAAWVDEVESARERILAEAEAAKAKAEADRLAAAEERKRAKEEAAASRLKAREEAAAERKRKQEEAAAAKAKAREEAAAKTGK